MKELKSRFITAWLYGGLIFKVLLPVTASTFLFSVTYTNSWFPQPAWISTILYISGIRRSFVLIPGNLVISGILSSL